MSTETETFQHEPNGDALAPGSKLLSGQYEILRYLSSGGFGITYLAKDSLNRTVVIKECFPEAFCSRINRSVRARTQNYLDDFKSIVKLFIREAHALSRLDHPSVVGVHQVFEDNDTAYMALDLVDGNDLLDIIESGAPKMQPEAVRQLTLKLLDAIGHVHSQDLLHRDISPDNILVDKSGHPVLIDFGAAREEASRKSRVLSAVLVVKDGYSPQEFYVAGSQQLPCSDLYALAATLSHLISGEAPPNSQARLAALASNQPDLNVPLKGRFPQYDEAFLEAIDKAMSIIPAERLQTAEEWTLMIDHRRRVEAARQKAMSDTSIDQTVMKLLESVNTDISDAESPVKTNETSKAADRAKDSETIVPVSKNASPSGGPQPVEDLSVMDAEPLEMLSEIQDEEERLTPYMRVKSKAIDAQQAGGKKGRGKSSGKWGVRRLATVPLIFAAYFFYAHTVLQYDAVQAATVQPILTLSAEFGPWNTTSTIATSSSGGALN